MKGSHVSRREAETPVQVSAVNSRAMTAETSNIPSHLSAGILGKFTAIFMCVPARCPEPIPAPGHCWRHSMDVRDTRLHSRARNSELQHFKRRHTLPEAGNEGVKRLSCLFWHNTLFPTINRTSSGWGKCRNSGILTPALQSEQCHTV